MLAETNKNLSNSLKKKFLYNNDINSIHLLINLYETEENIGNVFPSYLSMASLRKIVKRFLRGRPGNDLAAKNISSLLHNDINRLELLIYLEAYKGGYRSFKYANKLEKILLDEEDVKTIYSKREIREKIDKNKEISLLKEEILENLKNEARKSIIFNRLISTYNKRIIKPKLYKINKSLDKQVKMVEDDKGKTVLKYETKPFTRKELSDLYRKLSRIISEDGMRVLADAHWSGLIEKVLRRYK